MAKERPTDGAERAEQAGRGADDQGPHRLAAGPGAAAAAGRRRPLPPRHPGRVARRDGRGAQPGPGARGGRGGRRAAGHPDRLRPGQLAVVGRRRPSSTPSCSPASPCTPTRRLGWPRPAAWTRRTREIEALAADPRVRVIGETGLDTFRTGPDGAGRAGGVVPLAHRPGQADRQGAADPRPRRARRRAARAGRGGRTRADGAALLLRRRRVRAGVRAAAATTCPSRAR